MEDYLEWCKESFASFAAFTFPPVILIAMIFGGIYAGFTGIFIGIAVGTLFGFLLMIQSYLIVWWAECVDRHFDK